MKHGDGKFEAKLDFGLRCNAYAAVLAGIKKDIVAAAFGIDRRTISHMMNPTSKHYKRVRDEAAKMGPEAFKLHYFDEATLLRIQSMKLPEPGARIAPDPDAPNARAKAKAGIQIVRPEQCSYNHRLEIAFREHIPIGGVGHVGWQYRDLDGPDPEEWCNNGPLSMMTSQVCLEMAKANIYDA